MADKPEVLHKHSNIRAEIAALLRAVCHASARSVNVLDGGQILDLLATSGA